MQLAESLRFNCGVLQCVEAAWLLNTHSGEFSLPETRRSKLEDFMLWKIFYLDLCCVVPGLALWLGLMISIASLAVSPRFLLSTKIKQLSFLYTWGFMFGGVLGSGRGRGADVLQAVLFVGLLFPISLLAAGDRGVLQS